MKEGQAVGLSSLIKDLQKVAQAQPEELDGVASQRVKFPPEAARAETEVEDLNFSGEGNLNYHLQLSASYALPEEELESILREALGKSKGLRLPKGQYRTELKESWTPEAFSTEDGLPPFLTSKTNVTASATTVESEKVRGLGANKSIHIAEIELARNIMSIKTAGNYSPYFRQLAGMCDAQFAVVRFSEQDAQKLVQFTQQTAVGRFLADLVRRRLEPEPRISLQIDPAGMSLGIQEVIELTTLTRYIPQLEKELHLDLFKPPEDQETRIVKLIRKYGPRDILTNKRFADMKRVVGMLDKIAFSAVGNYEISGEQAKALLDKELHMLDNLYSGDPRYMFALGPDTHILRGSLVKRLAGELLGEGVLEPLQELDIDEYINYLVSIGYVPARFRREYLLADYSVKEKHLLEFYEQVYSQDPDKAVKLYRRSYINTAPSLSIDSEVDEDGSRIQRLNVASRARLFSFEIRQPTRSVSKNDFRFGRAYPNSRDARFWTRTRLSGSELLNFQEWACDKVGITFSQ